MDAQAKRAQYRVEPGGERLAATAVTADLDILNEEGDEVDQDAGVDRLRMPGGVLLISSGVAYGTGIATISAPAKASLRGCLWPCPRAAPVIRATSTATRPIAASSLPGSTTCPQLSLLISLFLTTM